MQWRSQSFTLGGSKLKNKVEYKLIKKIKYITLQFILSLLTLIYLAVLDEFSYFEIM
jgi:hypothetical protein